MPSASNAEVLVEDLPKGPLDVYRQKAKFEWKKLRLIFENEVTLRIKNHTWNILEKDPLFRKPAVTLPMDEQKRLAAMQFNKITEYHFQPDGLETAEYKPRVSIQIAL